MVQAIEAGRRVFSEFQQAYAERMGRGGVWSLSFDDADDADLGLTAMEVGTGLDVLLQKGLIKAISGSGDYQLTSEGREVCLHPEMLDVRLGPRGFAKVAAPNIIVNGGNVQVGDNNSQNITYGALLRAALQVAEEREEVPAPVAAALRRLQDFPDIESLMSEAAERAAES